MFFQERTKALEISRAELAAEVERLHSRTDADVDSGLGPGQHADSLSQLERSLNSKDKFISTMQEQILQLEGSLTVESIFISHHFAFPPCFTNFHYLVFCLFPFRIFHLVLSFLP